MQYSFLAGALTLALASPLVLADSTSSQTSTYSTTTQSAPSEPAYSSTRSEQKLDAYGNVIKKSESYNSKDPGTGNANSSSSTTVTSPDGSQSTVEKAHTSSSAHGDTSVTEKRTSTTSSQ